MKIKDNLLVEGATNIPARFRTTELENATSKIFISGSKQPIPDGFLAVKESLKDKDAKFIVCDLREEPHLYVIPKCGSKEKTFIIDYAIDAFNNYKNQSKTVQEINEYESEILEKLKQKQYANVRPSEKKLHREGKADKEAIKITKAFYEKTLLAERGMDYVRFMFTDHHSPNNIEVDKFISYFKPIIEKDESVHILFHCRGGMGRTATAMLMFDMMLNAGKDSYQTIVDREIYKNGHILNPPPDKKENYFKRATFIPRFYNYCKENNGFEKSWSTYIAEIEKNNTAEKEKINRIFGVQEGKPKSTRDKTLSM